MKVARLTTTKVKLLIFSTLECVLPTIKDISVLVLVYYSACCPHSNTMKSHECWTDVEMWRAGYWCRRIAEVVCGRGADKVQICEDNQTSETEAAFFSIFCPCCSSEAAVVYGGGSRSIPGQSLRECLCTKWHRARLFSGSWQCHSVSDLFPFIGPCRCVNLAVDSVFK